MSQENVEAIRRAQDAFNRRDKAAWIAVCDPEIENFPAREWPEGAPVRGAEAAWEFFVKANEAWEQGSYEWSEPIDAGSDKLVARLSAELQGKTSGAVIAWAYWVVCTFRNGRVLRYEWFADRADALEAPGLSE